jgi:hypothetical protein
MTKLIFVFRNVSNGPNKALYRNKFSSILARTGNSYCLVYGACRDFAVPMCQTTGRGAQFVVKILPTGFYYVLIDYRLLNRQLYMQCIHYDYNKFNY